jgi:hypothetical protein
MAVPQIVRPPDGFTGGMYDGGRVIQKEPFMHGFAQSLFEQGEMIVASRSIAPGA